MNMLRMLYHRVVSFIVAQWHCDQNFAIPESHLQEPQADLRFNSPPFVIDFLSMSTFANVLRSLLPSDSSGGDRWGVRQRIS